MRNTGKGKRLLQYVSDYVVFDLETTGINCYEDAIIEISAVRAKAGKVTETYSTLVNPMCHIPYGATRVNGITDAMVADAPEIEAALGEFLEFVGDSVLVGHNIASFDLNFVNAASLNLFGKTVDNDYIDTLYMAKSCLPQLKHKKLTDLAEYFHISAEGAHRALNDCIMNQKCYEEMAKIAAKAAGMPGADAELCPRCKGALVRRNGKFGEFYGCSNFPECRYTRNV